MKNKLKSYNVLLFIFGYIVVIVLILAAMGIYSYRLLVNTVYSDFMSGNEQYLSGIVNRHENDMQITDNITSQIGLMDENTRFRLTEKPEYAEELIKSLRGYTTVSQFFDFMFYHYHEDDYFFHPFSSMSKWMFQKFGAEFSAISTADFLEFATVKTKRLQFLPEQGIGGSLLQSYLTEDRYIVFARTVKVDFKDSLIFFIPCSYYDALLTDGENGMRYDFLLYDDKVIVTRGGGGIPEAELISFLEAEYADAQSKRHLVQKEVFIGKNEYLFTAQQGNSGICYGTLQSMDVYHDKVLTEQWAIFMLLLMCMLLAGGIIIFASKGFVSKIKQLNNLLNEDSFYDLNKIESGIQTLLTTYQRTEMEGLILKKTRFVRNFIRGDFESKEEAVAEAARAGLCVLYDQYLVVLMRSRERADENSTYAEILQTISQKPEVEGYGIHLINNNQNLFVLYADTEAAIEEIMQSMLKISRKAGNDYVIACSDCHSDFTEASKAYLEAVNAFDNYLLLDNSKVIRFTEVAQKEYVSMLPDSYLQRLKQAIRTGDKMAVEKTVKDICGKLNREKVSLYSFRIFSNDIIHILLSEWKGDKAQFDNFYNVFTLSQCMNIQEFGELLCEVCNMIIDSHSGKTVSVSDVVAEAIVYMKENCHNPELTMNTLAEYLGVSSVTLSVEFKNEMDMKPSDYLANLRMEKAKELLKNTDMRIKEISVQVGYEDDRVFMRRFKKYTGMTPGEYRSS
ncbi:MAG: helix-turn-helix transcriptional regulator [Lachnospiraceae bacterium]|nr:helix-turn-helix transcriptional regulator [Lachnospiraceae bacterium]